MTLCNCHLRSMHRVLRKVARRRRLHIALIAFTWNRKGNGTPSSINADHLHVFVHSSIQQKKTARSENTQNITRQPTATPLACVPRCSSTPRAASTQKSQLLFYRGVANTETAHSRAENFIYFAFFFTITRKPRDFVEKFDPAKVQRRSVSFRSIYSPRRFVQIEKSRLASSIASSCSFH